MIRQTVCEINDRHGSAASRGTEGSRPIEYLEGRIGVDTLVAYYRMADLALVSSVYNGMNLVAKEYVASQVDEAGVLLVSEMAGAADELTDALIVNPYDPEGMADAIKQALEMPEEERRHRMREMRTYLEAHDIHDWVDNCLRDAGVRSENHYRVRRRWHLFYVGWEPGRQHEIHEAEAKRQPLGERESYRRYSSSIRAL